MEIILYFIYLINLIKILCEENNKVKINIFCDICCEYFENIKEINLTIMNKNFKFQINNTKLLTINTYKIKNNIIGISYKNMDNNFIFFKENSICEILEIKNSSNYNIKQILLYLDNELYTLEHISFISQNQLRKLISCNLNYDYFPKIFIALQPISFFISPKDECILNTGNQLPNISDISFNSNADGTFANENIINSINSYFTYTPQSTENVIYKNLKFSFGIQLYCPSHSENCPETIIVCPFYCYECKIDEYNNKIFYSNYTFSNLLSVKNSLYQEEVSNKETYIIHTFKSDKFPFSNINFDERHYFNHFCSRLIRWYKEIHSGSFLFRVESDTTSNIFNFRVYNLNNNTIMNYTCRNFYLIPMNLDINDHLFSLKFVNYGVTELDGLHSFNVELKNQNVGQNNQIGLLLFQNKDIYQLGMYIKQNELLYRRKGYYYEEEYKFKIILDIFYKGNNYYEDSLKFELAETLKIRVFLIIVFLIK